MKTKKDALKAIEEDGLTVILMLTEQCNFECRHCFYSCGPDGPKGYMPQSVLEGVLQQIIDISDRMEYPNIKINLIGGEPTLNMDQFKRVLGAVIHWMEQDYICGVEMTTNGWWLHNQENTIKFLKVISEEVPEDRLGLDEGFTCRVSNDKWHNEFRPGGFTENGDRLKYSLSDIWDSYLQYKTTCQCSSCSVEFDEHLVSDEDDCPIKGCNGSIYMEEELLTDYYLPEPDADEAGWIYVEKYSDDIGHIVPLGRGEGIGRNDVAKTYCAAGGSLTYKPNGGLLDVCSQGSNFPAGTVRDDPLELMAMAMSFAEQQTSCYGCHEAAKAWLENNPFGWTKITPDTLPEQNTWVEIKDGDDIQEVHVTCQFEFVSHPSSKQCFVGATHWRQIENGERQAHGVDS